MVNSVFQKKIYKYDIEWCELFCQMNLSLISLHQLHSKVAALWNLTFMNGIWVFVNLWNPKQWIYAMWTLECLVRFIFCLYALLHLLHGKGLSPECVLMWLCRWLEEVQAWLHWLHLNGFSPVWILIMCNFNSFLVMLENSQVVHLCGFSQEGSILCFFISPDVIVA